MSVFQYRTASSRVTTVLFVRHGRTPMTGLVLSGWTPGLHLDERGQEQAAALADRLRGVPLAAVVSSPLERCVETVTPLLAGRSVGSGRSAQAGRSRHAGPGIELQRDERFGEVRYGEWTGRALGALGPEPLWRTVQLHPSAAEFPGGEALRDVQARAVAAVRDWNARLGEATTYVVCSHGDPLRMILADALGMHLDAFQRITIDPASVSVVRYESLRPVVVRMNDSCGDLAELLRPRRRSRAGRAGPAGIRRGPDVESV
jgi:probable phosphomutase (TIGR03848 family)